MKLRTILIWIFLFCGLTLFGKETKGISKSQKETQEEIDLKEFQEFKKMRAKQRLDGLIDDEYLNLKDPRDKNWNAFLQGGAGVAITQYEIGNVQYGKAGFEYKLGPSLGIGLSFGNNSIDLKSTDNISSQTYAYLLLSSYMKIQSQAVSSESAQLNQLLFAKLLDSPNAFFYISNTFKYRYNTGQVDFNIHFNRDNFLDPYIGLGIIGGSCTGIYPCQVRGGELKLGAQINILSFFYLVQIQTQIISIKEPGFESFQSNNTMASFGIGIKF